MHLLKLFNKSYKKKVAKIFLDAHLSNLVKIESFILGNELLSTEEKNRAVLIATEMFDNIVSHSTSNSDKEVNVEVSIIKTKKTILRFKYRTNNFYKIINADGNTRPYYDMKSFRYRGLGLIMCRNLSKSIKYKNGLVKSSINIQL